MISLQFEKNGQMAEVLSAEESSEPAMKDSEVMVKIMARPINPADHLFVQGQYRIKPTYPQVAGLEGAGVITAVGSDIVGFKTGDHVAFRVAGSWTQLKAFHPEQLIPVRSDLPFDWAAQLPLNPVTAFALLDMAGLESGDLLLLSAASSAVSGLIIQLAAMKGIRVIGMVRHPDLAHFVRNNDTVTIVDQKDNELANKISAICDGQGVAAFLDAVGGDVLTETVKLMRPKGKIILYGRLADQPAALFNGDLIYKNLTIQGFGIDHWLAGHSPQERLKIFQLLGDLIADGKLVLPETQHFKLADFRHALDADSRKRLGKVVLVG